MQREQETGGHGWGLTAVVVDMTSNNRVLSLPSSPPHCQIVRALEHLHSKLSVIHRGQYPAATQARCSQWEGSQAKRVDVSL